MCITEQTPVGRNHKLPLLTIGVKHMKNHKFIISMALIGIFISPAMVAAHETNSEPQIKEFIKDSAITAQIKTRLLTEGDIDSLNIKVQTDINGIVMLAGTVKTEAE